MIGAEHVDFGSVPVRDLPHRRFRISTATRSSSTALLMAHQVVVAITDGRLDLGP
jgi:hypothetical protein